MKHSFHYEHAAARLMIEGLPDYSLGHDDAVLGIVSGWSLTLVGAPELEGKREHLLALMEAVLPYSRYVLSGVDGVFGDVTGPVSIQKIDNKHVISLRSSKEGIEPLQIMLDDAELSDLVRCLDDLRFDPRIMISWNLPRDQPLPRNHVVGNIPLAQRFGVPLLGTSFFALIASFLLIVPIPSGNEASPPQTIKSLPNK